MNTDNKHWPDLASRSLGAGVIYFTGNYSLEVSVEACGAEGCPSPAELTAGSGPGAVRPRTVPGRT